MSRLGIFRDQGVIWDGAAARMGAVCVCIGGCAGEVCAGARARNRVASHLELVVRFGVVCVCVCVCLCVCVCVGLVGVLVVW